MSAYVVSPDTIDYIVTAAHKYETVFSAPLSPRTCDAATLAAAPVDYSHGNTFRISGSETDLIGALLLAQNVRSVNYRYSHHEPEETPDYVYRTVMFDRIDPIVVLKSVQCLHYQSCETDDYDRSFAAVVLHVITSAAISRLPGYSAAPWGWTRDGAR